MFDSSEPTPGATLYGAMTTSDDATLMALNELLIANRDAERGYGEAGDLVRVPELIELFAGFALQRGKFALELEERIQALRSTPVKGGSAFGALHRGWMDLRAAAEEDITHAHAVLAECERAEDIALRAYAAALKLRDIDEISRTLVQKQYEQVQVAHDRVRQLRDRASR